MTDKDRFMSLLCAVECKGEEARGNCPERRHGQCRTVQKLEICQIGVIADYLLANGVIVPPVKMRQTVYSIENGISQVMEGEVYEICIRREGVVFRATRKGYFSLAFTAENIGKTVFLTREEAEKALAEGSRNESQL